jgi:hypothetical protein
MHPPSKINHAAKYQQLRQAETSVVFDDESDFSKGLQNTELRNLVNS